MMTPKEKAEELKNQFDMVIYTDQNHDGQVKRCALKSANETLKVLWNLYDNPNTSDSVEIIIKEQIDFWADVKSELS
jgi:protein-tyrosine-phosphatase